MRKAQSSAQRLIICCSLFASVNAAAQFQPDSVILNKGISSAVESYQASQGLRSPIFNGAEHIRYSSNIEGFAYYLASDWQTGTVTYEGKLYKGINILYDLHKDEVIIEHPSRIPIVLFRDKVDAFTIGNREFVFVDRATTPELKTGFYEKLKRGPFTLYVKREKLIDEKVVGIQLEKKFVQRDKYYLQNGTEFITVNHDRDILRAVKEHRNEVKQYLSDNNLRFKNDPETTLLQALDYYNQITNR